ncbi:hypothetical protein [Bordetella bronchiseptica]|uniref:hypothetical protein n=1 Tax=Bordetella bronchiseptica TaxID=518 RepID=UPI0012685409|nr:hypothetical protein [Bordetella bronchiseptica]
MMKKTNRLDDFKSLRDFPQAAYTAEKFGRTGHPVDVLTENAAADGARAQEARRNPTRTARRGHH